MPFTTVERNELYDGARQGGYVPDEEEQEQKASQKKVLKSKGKIVIDDI
jgi:hypothetical protein